MTTTDENPEPSTCPWCGLSGYWFDESDPPADYCHHDPADVVEEPKP